MGTDCGANSCGVRQWQSLVHMDSRNSCMCHARTGVLGEQVERELGSLGSFLIMEPSPPSTG